MIGVIQGRLLEKYNGRYQAHPLGYWQKEFFIAKDLGLDCIEFILDFDDFNKNPLLSDGGIEEIQKISEESKVQVKTICADYFMEAPLHSKKESTVINSIKVLKSLLKSSLILGITDIVIPCVDQSSLETPKATEKFITSIRSILPLAERTGVNLCLETDLAPQPFIELIESFNSDRVTVNYDTGNSASLGYNPIEELEHYGHKITDIHIKDRMLNGASVTLGSGNTNFDVFFEKLKQINYKGPFILQAFRDDEGLEIFKKQFNWIKPLINEYSK